jgi:precorrin-6A/cobalt-precorrin-6A reductase
VRRRILILGGTGEGRELARRLNLQGYDVITSLAGATAAPLLPEGSIRRGGFGGSSGLEEFLRKEEIALVIDATHPFAVQMSLNGSAAAESSGIGFLRLERPAWSPQSGDRWIAAKEIAEAALLAPSGARILVHRTARTTPSDGMGSPSGAAAVHGRWRALAHAPTSHRCAGEQEFRR